MTDKTGILISGLHLALFLGWPDAERQKAQTVILDIELQFAKALKACDTDLLADTFCYDTLSEAILAEFSQRTYRLVEHLGKNIARFIAQKVAPSTEITVDITKHPKIPGLHGFIRFRYECVA